MSQRNRILIGLLALALAGLIWFPSVHCLFARSASSFHSATGLSPAARALAERQLRLWQDPLQRQQELARMRRSNAEWDFMGRSFLVWSLANIGLRDSTAKHRNLDAMDRIIDETLRLEREKGICGFLMPYAHTNAYVVQPARSLFIDGEIALMLGARRLLDEKAEYKPLLEERVRRIDQGLRQSPHLVLESYPNECWMFDHAVALAALRLADRLDDSDHGALIHGWVEMAKKTLVHPATGLLISSFTVKGAPLDGPEGSSLWIVTHFLQVLDADFARDQYERARRELGTITLGFGYAHEWPASWRGVADVDSGPILPGLDISAGSSGTAVVAASAFGDERFLAALAATLDFAAFPSRQGGALKYCASNQVGDATLLYAATLGPMWERIQTGGRP